LIANKLNLEAGTIQYLHVGLNYGLFTMGPTYRLILAYSDADNYVCVESANGAVQLFSRSGGVDSAIGSPISVGANFFDLYYDPSNGDLKFIAPGTAYSLTGTATGFTGVRAALAITNYVAGQSAFRVERSILGGGIWIGSATAIP